LIIRVVTHGDTLRTNPLRGACQERVSCLPSRLFQRKPAPGGNSFHIHPLNRTREIPCPGELRDVLRICVGFSSTQRMIEVSNVKAQTKLRHKTKQDMGQAERIGTTRDTNNDRIAGLQERMAVDVGGNA